EIGVQGERQPRRNLKLSSGRGGFRGRQRLLVRSRKRKVGDTYRRYFNGCIGSQRAGWNEKGRRTVIGNDVGSQRSPDYATTHLRSQCLALSGHAGQEPERVPRPKKSERKYWTGR